MESEQDVFLSEKVATSLESARSSQVPGLVLVGENAYKSNIDTNTIFTVATPAITIYRGLGTV